MNEKKTSWKIISDSASESTAHGIPHAFKRENIWLKIFWTVCTLASAGVCGWFLAKAIVDYNKHETVTQTKTIYEIPTFFPTVSICNKNAFTTQAGFDYVETWLNDNGAADLESIKNIFLLQNFDIYRYLIGVSVLDKSISNERRKNFSLQLDEMLISCNYNNQECDTEDFFWYFDTYYGSCFSFNIGKNANGETIKDKFSTKAGVINGLKLELFIGEPTNINSLSYVNGLHVLVHNKTEKPTYLQGINANVGAYTYIAVNREFSSRLEKPYSECIQEIVTLAKDQNLIYVLTLLEANYTYTQADCLNVCLQDYIVSECECYVQDFPYRNTTNVESCHSLTQINCFSSLLTSFFSIDVNELCPNECPLECDSIIYQTTVSTIDYPSVVYADGLKSNSFIQDKFNGSENVTLEELRRNILAINVYYNKLSYKSITEVEKTQLIDLVAGIGGTLGLFLGVSFLSFIEIIDIVFLLMLNQPKKNTNVVDPIYNPPAQSKPTPVDMS